jgi:hypothetical protein
MRSWLLTTVLLLGAGPLGHAQEGDDSVKAINDAYFATLRTNSAKPPPQGAPAGVRPALISEEELQALIDRCWKVYDVSSGEPEEFEALKQVMTLSASPYVTPTSEKSASAWRDAAKKLFADFIDDDRMAPLAMGMPSSKAVKREADDYAKQLKGSKSTAVQAAYAVAPLNERLSAAANTPLDEAGEKQLVADLDAFAKAHGAAKSLRGSGTYGEWAKNASNAIVNLKIGKVAPEIEAADLDGVNFKLSDYRGKVVLLDFWGYW